MSVSSNVITPQGLEPFQFSTKISSPSRRREWGSNAQLWLVIGVLTLSAFATRAWNLDAYTITHPEVYAPGIDFPPFSTHPIERRSVGDIIRSSLLTDNHPPGYYLLVLPWNHWFGPSLTALRLPSVLIGTLTIPVEINEALQAEPLYGAPAGFLLTKLRDLSSALRDEHSRWRQLRLAKRVRFAGRIANERSMLQRVGPGEAPWG